MNEDEARTADSRRLLVLDVEGTLFESGLKLRGTELTSTIWQAIATELGPEAVREEVETHGRWDRGEYSSYVAWMLDTIRIHRRHGLTESVFQELIAAASYNPGIEEAIRNVDREQWIPVLVSGGFRALAARAQADLNILHSFTACDYLFGDDGRIAGFNVLPCDFEGKLDFIRLMLREYRLADSAWAFVGDGANDVPIAMEAPYSIGYRAHPALRMVTTAQIDTFDNLIEVLRDGFDA
jgi:phosphoserine phosphatase